MNVGIVTKYTNLVLATWQALHPAAKWDLLGRGLVKEGIDGLPDISHLPAAVVFAAQQSAVRSSRAEH